MTTSWKLFWSNSTPDKWEFSPSGLLFLLAVNGTVRWHWYVRLVSSPANKAATEWGLVVFTEGGGPGQNCSPGCSGMPLTGRHDLSRGNWGNPHWAGCKGFPAVKQTNAALCLSQRPHQPLLDRIILVETTFQDVILGCKAHFCCLKCLWRYRSLSGLRRWHALNQTSLENLSSITPVRCWKYIVQQFLTYNNSRLEILQSIGMNGHVPLWKWKKIWLQQSALSG